ncbi:MAG: transglutaminase-like cysteine peptidase [Pseudolabrys sp.]
MSASARAAQIFSLIVAVIVCHGASTDAHPSGLATAIEATAVEPPAIDAFAAETASVQVAPESNKPEQAALPRLAMLMPEQSVPREEYPSTNAEPFGLPTMPALPSDASAKWSELQSRLLAEEKILAACRTEASTCPVAARRLLSIVELGRQHHGRALLGQINRAVNLSIRPMSDWAQYGVADYWATPLESLNSGAGDCEDYAIAKYVALRESGIAPDDLRLLIVSNVKEQTTHAVLAVHFADEWQILDNRTLIMVNADAAQHYLPLFALDQHGVRTFVTAVARR